MNKAADWGAFCDLMSAAAKVTRTQAPQAEGLTLMFDLLSEYTLEQVQAGIAAHLRSPEGKFFPTPSHIIQQIDGTAAERANYAWRVFLKALDKHGYYDSVRFPDPAYHYAITLLGGWVRVSSEFNDMTDREINFRRAEFLSLYQRGERVATFGREPGKEQVAPYLLGAFERDNTANGYTDHIPPVVEIATGRKVKQSELAALSGGAKHSENKTTGALAASLSAKKRVESDGKGSK